MGNKFILTLSCKDKAGIVAKVSGLLFEIGGFVIQSSQFGDESTDTFFMRVEFECDRNLTEITDLFSPIGVDYSMNWQMTDIDKKPKILLAVTKASHCLVDLLHKSSIGALGAEIVGVISNREDLKGLTEKFDKEFIYLPIKQSKALQEKQIVKVFEEKNAELLVLARYMQILSNETCEKLQGRAINIHHSFLPSFKGANPYRQAYERGVKIIGATAHYVTSDLDEGPIIEQEVTRVDHSEKPNDLMLKGQDTENRVLFNAVKWHLERRVILNGSKTVIFK